ncbi:hypothetical protein F4803DRAFT_291128 [Xylaria telfairii]|nr:hypothetical protein F4803DRAFT_291128 [Xylaria telfairii]
MHHHKQYGERWMGHCCSIAQGVACNQSLFSAPPTFGESAGANGSGDYGAMSITHHERQAVSSPSTLSALFREPVGPAVCSPASLFGAEPGRVGCLGWALLVGQRKYSISTAVLNEIATWARIALPSNHGTPHASAVSKKRVLLEHNMRCVGPLVMDYCCVCTVNSKGAQLSSREFRERVEYIMHARSTFSLWAFAVSSTEFGTVEESAWSRTLATR